jgi:hypothetical protein
VCAPCAILLCYASWETKKKTVIACCLLNNFDVGSFGGSGNVNEEKLIFYDESRKSWFIRCWRGEYRVQANVLYSRLRVSEAPWQIPILPIENVFDKLS